MSDSSLSDSSSAMSISTASSPTTSEHDMSLHVSQEDEAAGGLMNLPEGNLLGFFEHASAPRRPDALNSHPPYPLSARPLSPRATHSPAKRQRLAPSALSLPPPDHMPSGPISPFAFQDPESSMTSPWLVRVVLDLHDVKGVCWMNIKDVLERMYGVRTGSDEILEILSGNGRVRRVWWD